MRKGIYFFACLSIYFVSISMVSAATVTSFTLINADTDLPISGHDPLVDGSLLVLDDLPTTNLNIRANTSPAVVSQVRFDFDGQQNFHSESAAPYALFGDSSGDYNSWSPGNGNYELTAKAIQGGTTSPDYTIDFTIVATPIEAVDTFGFIMSPWMTKVLPDDSIALNFAGVDPDNSLDSFLWRQISGPQANISDPNNSFIMLDDLSAGFYVFELEMTDIHSNLTAFDQYVVRVFDPNSPAANPVITGEKKQWHTLTLTFDGPAASENIDPNEPNALNPFYDMRLDVLFTNGDKNYLVPGYFAADGQAAYTSAEAGNKWRVKFTPDSTGNWDYYTSFRIGSSIAIGHDPNCSISGSLDGLKGSFVIEESDKVKPDFRSQGRLNYIGEHYMQFEGSKEYFLKGGANSPENFLAFEGFDGTYDTTINGDLFIHAYEPHAQDVKPDDPNWQVGRNRNIFGAVNYLAEKGMNVIYFITYNIDGGDGEDVWPWSSPTQRFRFDCSKLDQWEILFSHMEKLGIMMHVLTQETENDDGLDLGHLGDSRRLYYRELIARFSHHLALQWNLGEENTNTDIQRRSFARYFKQFDPYKHPIVIHTYPWEVDLVYNSLLGFEDLDGASLQVNSTYLHTNRWTNNSAAAGKPWVVTLDEVAQAIHGVVPDDEDPEHDNIRKNYLWANLMAGGAGCEWYFGYGHPNMDIDCEDWRSRNNMWDQTRYALKFFKNNHIPFWKMNDDNSYVTNASADAFVDPGNYYVVYLPDGGTTDLDLQAFTEPFSVLWYDPRNGGELQSSNVLRVEGPGLQSLGSPPNETSKDWVVLVKSKCLLDTNQDDIINKIDLSFLFSIWMKSTPQALQYDCNDDGLINFQELQLYVQNWLSDLSSN